MHMEEEIIKNKLKPCPFCGGDARFTYTTYEEPPMYSVVCTKCKVMIKKYGKDREGNRTDLCYKTISEVSKVWNKRIQ